MIPITTDKDKQQLREHALELLKQNQYEGLSILIEELQDTGTKPLIRTNYLNVFLVNACRNGHKRVIKYLLGRYKSLANNQEAFVLVTYMGFLDITQQIVEQNAKLSDRKDLNIDRGLRNASSIGDLDMVKYLESQGADIHALNDYALGLASTGGHLGIVRYLIEKGSDPHADDDYALRCASKSGQLEVVKYLVEHGANIHANSGEALCWAAKYGNLEVVKYLVEQGADIHAHSDYALRWASYNKHAEIVAYLKEVLKNDSSQHN